MAIVRIGEILVSLGVTLFAQQAATPPAFEVASIKPSQDPPGSPSGISESNGRILAKHVTLRRCVRGAYNVPETQIFGGPKWAHDDRYYIEAKSTTPAGGSELMVMLQTLLAERFKLVLHREMRAISGYRLVQAKGGLKAKSSAPDTRSVGLSRRRSIDAQGSTMSQVAFKLSEALHWPVVDATNVPGRFDVKLEWSSDDSAAADPATSGPTIFEALQTQLGLKLESGKVTAEVLVIDSAEKPSEN